MNALSLALALSLLDADDFAHRELGSASLVRLVRADPGWAGPVAARAADGYPSAEARSRARRTLGHYRLWLADTFTPSTVPCWPCLDALPHQWGHRYEIVGTWRPLAGTAPAPGMDCAPYWWSWRRATELWIRQQIRDGWNPAEADEFLSRMWTRELEMTAEYTPQHFEPMLRDWAWADGWPRP